MPIYTKMSLCAMRHILRHAPIFEAKTCGQTVTRGATYLDALNHPVGEFEGGHRGARDEGVRTTLESAHDATVSLVLLHRQPEQVSHALH